MAIAMELWVYAMIYEVLTINSEIQLKCYSPKSAAIKLGCRTALRAPFAINDIMQNAVIYVVQCELDLHVTFSPQSPFFCHLEINCAICLPLHAGIFMLCYSIFAFNANAEDAEPAKFATFLKTLSCNVILE